MQLVRCIKMLTVQMIGIVVLLAIIPPLWAFIEVIHDGYLHSRWRQRDDKALQREACPERFVAHPSMWRFG